MILGIGQQNPVPGIERGQSVRRGRLLRQGKASGRAFHSETLHKHFFCSFDHGCSERYQVVNAGKTGCGTGDCNTAFRLFPEADRHTALYELISNSVFFHLNADGAQHLPVQRGISIVQEDRRAKNVKTAVFMNQISHRKPPF